MKEVQSTLCTAQKTEHEPGRRPAYALSLCLVLVLACGGSSSHPPEDYVSCPAIYDDIQTALGNMGRIVHNENLADEVEHMEPSKCVCRAVVQIEDVRYEHCNYFSYHRDTGWDIETEWVLLEEVASSATTNRAPPKSADGVPSISSGYQHVCALDARGAADCWGSIIYDSRQLQNRSNEDEYERGDAPANEKFIDISVGPFHVCGVRNDGSPLCWGEDNRHGRLFPPTGERLTAISNGYDHTCGLTFDGFAVCWGSNSFGQTAPPSGEKFTAISSGYFHTCGLRADGFPVCWGSDRGGRASPPLSVQLLSISSGGSHTCGLLLDDSPRCWGPQSWLTDTPVTETFKSISSGVDHTCALRPNGSPVCWGIADPKIMPPADEQLIAISSGQDQTCGLRLDGSHVCWGTPFQSSPSPTCPPRATMTILSNGVVLCAIEPRRNQP